MGCVKQSMISLVYQKPAYSSTGDISTCIKNAPSRQNIYTVYYAQYRNSKTLAVFAINDEVHAA
jgi:hypothetical protein